MYKKRTTSSAKVAALLTVVLTVFIAACADDGGGSSNNGNGDGNGGDTMHDYVCANGIKADGKTDTANTNKCASCDSGHYLDSTDESCKQGNAFVCENGTPADDAAPNANTNKCKSCGDGYSLDVDNACVGSQPYICANGTPADGGSAVKDTNKCASCKAYYKLDDKDACIPTVYTCDNGTLDNARVGQTPFDNNEDNTTTDVQACSSCKDYYKLDDTSCIDTVYVCDEGVADTTTTPAQDMHATVASDVTKCSDCSSGYTLNGSTDLCELTLVGTWKFDSNASCTTTPTCTVTLTASGGVSWSSACSAHAPLDSYSTFTIDESSIVLQGESSQHDFTVETDGNGAFVLNPHSSNPIGNRYLCSTVGLGAITPIDGTLTQNAASFSVTPSHSGTIHWVLYTDGVDAPNAVTIINDATNDLGIKNSGAAGITATANQSATIEITALDALTDYDLYVVLTTTVGGTTQRAAADKYDVKTLGYPYQCDSGDAADGMAATPNVQLCANCTTEGFYKHGDGTCLAHGTLKDGYGLLANGVTVSCPGVDNLASFTIGDTTYTKRTKQQIETNRTLAASSCTTGIDDMSLLFNNQLSFNGDISHWDTSSVITMEFMFLNADAFTQDISNWDASQVKNMSGMFRNSDFNQDISKWDVGSVENMRLMFAGAPNFNQDIGRWDVSEVDDMDNMFNGATSFTHDISEWCVVNINNEPNDFDDGTDSMIWLDANKPQWGTAQGNNCQVNFTTQPTVSAKTAATATIPLTPSEDASLYWILRTSATNYATSTALKADIGGTSAIQDSTANGVSVDDDTPYNIELDSLSTQTTYYLYAALEVEVDGTVTESVVSDEVAFVSACDDGYGEQDNACIAVQSFGVAANGVTVTCDDVDVGTAGIINDDTSTVYVKRTRDQITLDNASTTCTSGISDMSYLFSRGNAVFNIPSGVGNGNFNRDISHWDTSAVTTMHGMFEGPNSFNQDISAWDVRKVTNMDSMFRGAHSFNQNLSQWCVSHLVTPFSFENVNIWDDANKPQWSSAKGNNCQVNYTNQPTVSAKTATTATVQLTPSEDATLYWVLHTGSVSYDTSTALRAAIGGTSAIQDSTANGVSVNDDMPHDINLTGLTANTPYYLYIAVEQEANNTLIDSALADPLMFTTSGCQTGEGSVDGMCVAVQAFSVAANEVTIICDDVDVGTPGIINNDNSVVYVKRNAEQITTDNAATSCTSGISDMGGMFTATAVDVNGDNDTDDAEDYPAVSGAASFNGDISHWDTSAVTNMAYMFNGASSFNQNIGNWDVSSVATTEGFSNMFATAAAFDNDISEWCVMGLATTDTPSGFATDTNTSWSNNEKPQWGTGKGNLCPLNFVVQPEVEGFGNARFAGNYADIRFTPSKAGRYTIAFFNNSITNPTYTTVADFDAGVGVADFSSSTSVGDDSPHTYRGTGLTVGGTYHVYVSMETDTESVLSEKLTFVAQE